MNTARKPKWRRKAEERPTALYAAALQVFSLRGYHATRLEEVGALAGVSKGTIYHYFRNKEDLLQRALEHKMESFLAQAEAALEGFKGNASEKLRFFFERAWKRWQVDDWGRFNKLMLGEIATELPKLFQLWAKKGLMQAWRLTEQIIEEGQQTGEFRKDAHAKSIARLLHSGLSHQASLQWHMGLGKHDRFLPAQALDASLDFAIRGLREIPSLKRKA